jgi:iron complex transport system substrate-binding protein
MVWRVLLAVWLTWSGAALAAGVTDATGRSVDVPGHPTRVLPAGPPAAILLEAIAPDLMVGWPSPLSDEQRALLPPSAGKLPQVPRLTGRDDVTDKIVALKPDLPKATQQKTGIPTLLLDGSMAEIPHVLRMLGGVLHREGRAETLANFAEAMLALPPSAAHPRVLYARGADGLLVAAPGTDVTEDFTRLGWQAVAPDGPGMFRPSSIEAIRALDPDMILFSDPAMRATVMHDDAWRSVRTVREGHAYVSPSLPFGWVEEPPSINRLLGLAWLSGRDPLTLAALFNATVYGQPLTPVQLETVLGGAPSVQP